MSLIDKARESEINSYFKLEEDYQSLVDHAQDLERQLAEAREILSSIMQCVEHLGMNSSDGHTLAWVDELFIGVEKLTTKSEGGEK